MATDLSQDAVLRFLHSNGGSVKNSDLLLHFRGFIRDHADRDRNRELFKKFVNSVATVRQDGGASYIVLKKQLRGYVPGGGGGGSSGPPRVPAGKITETSPQSTNQSSAVSAEKPRLKPPPRGGDAPAPPGETARITILPAAGIMVNNNNNNVETSVNRNQLNSAADVSGRRAAAQKLKTPSLSESPVQGESTKEGQPGITAVVPAVRHHGETNQQVPLPQIHKGREAHFQSDRVLHQEPPLHHVSLDSEVPPRRIRYRPSYKSAVSCDEEEEEEEELPVRQSPGGAVWPVIAPPRDSGRPVLFSSPRIMHGPAPHSVVSSSSSEKKPPKIFIQDIEEESLVACGPGWSSESGLEMGGQHAGTGLNHGSLSGESASTRRSLPLEAEPRPPPTVHQDRRHSQTAGVQLEPTQGLHQNQRGQPSSSHNSVFSSSSDAGFSSSDWPPSASSRESGWNSSFDDLQAKTGTTSVWMLKLKHKCDYQKSNETTKNNSECVHLNIRFLSHCPKRIKNHTVQWFLLHNDKKHTLKLILNQSHKHKHESCVNPLLKKVTHRCPQSKNKKVHRLLKCAVLTGQTGRVVPTQEVLRRAQETQLDDQESTAHGLHLSTGQN